MDPCPEKGYPNRTYLSLNLLQVLLEGTGCDSDGKGECQRKRQDDPGWVQAERQRQIQHPGHDNQRDGCFFGVVVNKGAFPAAAPSPQIPPHQPVNQCH